MTALDRTKADLRRLMAEEGLTQRALAARLGVKQSSVWSLLAPGADVGLARLARVAEAMGRDMVVVFVKGEAGAPESTPADAS